MRKGLDSIGNFDACPGYQLQYVRSPEETGNLPAGVLETVHWTRVQSYICSLTAKVDFQRSRLTLEKEERANNVCDVWNPNEGIPMDVVEYLFIDGHFEPFALSAQAIRLGNDFTNAPSDFHEASTTRHRAMRNIMWVYGETNLICDR